LGRNQAFFMSLWKIGIEMCKNIQRQESVIEIVIPAPYTPNFQ
jgi:hypothetical protein